MAALIADLLGKYPGPILVIGGGPSVPDDFARLPNRFKPACVLSANAHGFMQDRFKVDYIVACDNKHSETREPMKSILAPHGVPVITRHWWGDFRLPRWPLHLNSGQTAIAVGVLLGGRPVVAAGMDCWQGKTYWHNPDIKVACTGRSLGYVAKQLTQLKDWIGAESPVRVLSGPMIPMFPRWQEDEEFPETLKNRKCVAAFQGLGSWVARAEKAVSWNLAEIPAGAEFPVSKLEALNLRANWTRYHMTVREVKREGVDTPD